MPVSFDELAAVVAYGQPGYADARERVALQDGKDHRAEVREPECQSDEVRSALSGEVARHDSRVGRRELVFDAVSVRLLTFS